MSATLKIIICIMVYIIFAPVVGGLTSGIDRKITARMQGRQGPPLLQPFYDVFKLLKKQTVVINHVQIFYLAIFLVFVIFTGCLFFGGFDLLLVFFALTTANIFLILAATSSHSPYANMGANREMMQMLSYEPMVLLTAVGFYLATNTFKVREIITSTDIPPIIKLPGIFVGFVFILTIKLRKHPFDLATSHHAHQEMVKGITTEFSGEMFAIVEIAHWYENVFLMGVVGLFFINANVWTALIALICISITYFILILVDNTNARMKWQKMFKNSWVTTLIVGALNVFILEVFVKGVQ
ncbi:MAG: NADH-quinone oxidoreductase subunit H [Acetobacter sp.]|nr:NADH-quinone oxidoreductase subunit H [Bacteroides sp.]MCM1341158.1 NADH-quinone oxidoreductase subunit H [Acetobacter sp.]MCM1433508.1 NADH-quinone oxidoreductase subunit H [Clostridiales bacterium]